MFDVIEGYGIDVDYDGRTLRIHGRNKATRIALAGAEHNAGDVVLDRSEVAGVDFKDAGRMVNGNLRVRTAGGKTYQLHFRRKQAAGFRELAAALEAADSSGDLRGHVV